MQDLNNIKSQIAEMAEIALDMIEVTHKTFMEHDMDLSAPVLKNEDKLNRLEKELTKNLIDFGNCPGGKKEKFKVTIYVDMIGNLELIGDYCKDILERVQIKIEENLLFSDAAIKDYNDLYKKTLDALKNICAALKKDDVDFAKDVSKDKYRIDNLVEAYRKHHEQRLIKGICSPLAGNMFLNMLDYTAQIFHHTKAIADKMIKLK
jgi:phosphate:Na+ symporter